MLHFSDNVFYKGGIFHEAPLENVTSVTSLQIATDVNFTNPKQVPLEEKNVSFIHDMNLLYIFNSFLGNFKFYLNCDKHHIVSHFFT